MLLGQPGLADPESWTTTVDGSSPTVDYRDGPQASSVKLEFEKYLENCVNRPRVRRALTVKYAKSPIGLIELILVGRRGVSDTIVSYG